MSKCGATGTTTGKPCKMPVPRERCPHHGDGERPNNGRPSLYTESIAEHVCREISKGRSLKAICREDEGTPGHSTVLEWVADDREGFSDRYAHACHLRLHVLAEELLEISDDGTNDTYVDEKGRERVDYDVVQRSKLRVDSRKWLLSRLMPEKYGDRQRLEHSGAIAGGDVHVYLPENGRASLPDPIRRRTELVSGNGKP